MEKIRIGITQGDVNGVGIEVILKSLSNPDILELFTPIVFGNEEMFRQTAQNLGIEDIEFNIIKDYADIKDGKVNLKNVEADAKAMTPGTASPAGGKAAVDALEAASEAIEKGEIDLLVTAPIDKNTAQNDKFHFPGHTEYLADRYMVEGSKALMIMTSGALRVALVTTHLPMTEVPSKVTAESVAEALRAFASSLRMDFGCERPKIAVLSLNPHCGDGGVLGTEEQEKIVPAIEQCRKEGIMAFGPVAADGFFGSGAYKKFDGVLAMYHDQGLAPFKVLASGAGVNFTAGLNIIRTSPAHGTGYDIAGKGLADESSMREAIYEAIDIARRRDRFLDASENPLPVREITSAKKNREKKDDETIAQ